MRSDVAKLAQA